MSETLGPSEEELGLNSNESSVQETESPKKFESYAELVGAVHEQFGDDGVKTINILHLEPELAKRQRLVIDMPDETLESLITFIDDRGGATHLDRLKWVLDSRRHYQETKNPWSGPEFPG